MVQYPPQPPWTYKHAHTGIKHKITILGYPGVIPLATSTPGTISWISFDEPLNEYYHLIGFILIFRMSKMTNENDPYKRAVIWSDRTL